MAEAKRPERVATEATIRELVPYSGYPLEEGREQMHVDGLNLLLGLSHEQGLVFGRFWIERDGVRWRGGASGESWRRDLERGVEVKGATLTMLEVKQGPDGWRARCVVDV